MLVCQGKSLYSEQKEIIFFIGFLVIDHIFRQYDIRGKVGSELIIEQVPTFVKALAYYFKQQFPALKKVAVGIDGRTHSPQIKEATCTALQESGIDVVFIGLCPTPLLYFSLFTQDVDAGIMITASHNPKEYNGFKICLNKEVVWGAQLQEIKKLFFAGAQLKSQWPGTYQEVPLTELYIEWMYKHFQHLVGMKIRVVIDCGNGATGAVMPALVKKFAWPAITLLYEEVDGTYPNHEADPNVEENMVDLRARVGQEGAALGIGFDGDGDRMAAMTNTGYLVPGDKLLAVFAQEVLHKHPHSAVVFDIKCSSGLTELLERWQAQLHMVPSGHAIIKHTMKKHKALLGGELSCHFFFADDYFGFDDGIYAALRLLSLLHTTQKSLEELLQIFPKRYTTKEYRVACSEQSKNKIVEAVKEVFCARPDAHVLTIDGVRVLVYSGWGMVRASNTQPVVCLRFEATSPENVQKIKQEFVAIIEPFISPQELQELYGA